MSALDLSENSALVASYKRLGKGGGKLPQTEPFWAFGGRQRLVEASRVQEILPIIQNNKSGTFGKLFLLVKASMEAVFDTTTNQK